MRKRRFSNEKNVQACFSNFFAVALVFLSICAMVAEPMPVKVGVVLPLSGNIAQTGALLREAMLIAQDVVNNKYEDFNVPMAAAEGFSNLGGAKLELVFLDSQNVPEKAMSATEQLITQEKVVAVMGACSSACTVTASNN